MFRGNIIRPSHEGGLLISFEGSSPALGTTLETDSGIRLGKVDTVLGSIHKPWVHVYPVAKGLDVVSVLGEDTIISNRKNSQKHKPRRENRNSKYSRNNRSEKKIFNDNDWICQRCKNDNFSWRERCNKCSSPREYKNKGQRSSWNRSRRDSGKRDRNQRGKNIKRTDSKSWIRNGRKDNQSLGNNTSKKTSIRRIRGKSKSHFKNRELDNIFKRRSK